MFRFNKNVIAILVVCAILVAAVVFRWINQEKSDEKHVEWETYESETYGFSFEHPSNWVVEVDTSSDFSPKINVYPSDLSPQLPITHFSNITNVSFFPLGIPTEGMFAERVDLHFPLDYSDSDSSHSFIMEDGTPFATFIRPSNAPNSWNGSGFVWARVLVEDLSETCIRDGEEIDEATCDPLTEGDTIVRSGEIDEDTWDTLEKILTSVEFNKEIKANLIRVDSPKREEHISSPLTIEGEARGYWFFEATFPVILTNWDGLIIAEGYAEAQDEWMTEEFVPFTAELTFEKPEYGERGFLILQKANASGLPEHDDALEVPIYFD